MSTRIALPLLLTLALVVSACCTTPPDDTAWGEPPDRGTVMAAGWESGVAAPDPLPRVGTMTTPGSEPTTAREAESEMESLRRGNKRLMDQVAKLMHQLELIREGRAAPEPAPAVRAEAPAPPPERAAIDVAGVRAALRRAGAGDLEVSRNGDGQIAITLSGGMSFLPGRAELTTSARARIRQIGSAISRRFPGIRIRVEGHTDSDPIRKSKWASNRALSLARANAVAGYLVETSGISPDRVEPSGYGSARPLASNSTREGKAKNRRVELVLVE